MHVSMHSRIEILCVSNYSLIILITEDKSKFAQYVSFEAFVAKIALLTFSPRRSYPSLSDYLNYSVIQEMLGKAKRYDMQQWSHALLLYGTCHHLQAKKAIAV